MTFKVSESIWELKKAKKLGKYKIFLMAVYMTFKYSKRFRFASLFNKHFLKLLRVERMRGEMNFYVDVRSLLRAYPFANYQKHKTTNKRFLKKRTYVNQGTHL